MFITFCKTREKRRSNTFPGPSPKPSPEVQKTSRNYVHCYLPPLILYKVGFFSILIMQFVQTEAICNYTSLSSQTISHPQSIKLDPLSLFLEGERGSSLIDYNCTNTSGNPSGELDGPGPPSLSSQTISHSILFLEGKRWAGLTKAHPDPPCLCHCCLCNSSKCACHSHTSFPVLPSECCSA